MFEVGGGGVLQACQPSVIRIETPSFWRLKSLSFEGHLEKQMKSIFGNQVYATVVWFSFDNLFLRW